MASLDYSSSDDDLPHPATYFTQCQQDSNVSIRWSDAPVGRSTIQKQQGTLSHIVETRMYEKQAHQLLHSEENTVGSDFCISTSVDLPKDDDDDYLRSDVAMDSFYCDLCETEIFKWDQVFVLFNCHEVSLESFSYVPIGELTRYEKALLDIPPEVLSKRLSTFLTCYHPSSIRHHKTFILFLLKTIAVSPYPASVTAAQQMLLHLLNSVEGQISSNIFFYDLYDIFLNFGLDVNVYCPIESLPQYLEVKTNLKSKSSVVGISDNSIIYNLNAVFTVLPEIMRCCAFNDEELTQIVLLLIWMNIDKKLSLAATRILIQRCIASAFDNMSENGLKEKLPLKLAEYSTSQANSEICDQLSIRILRSLPVYSVRGRIVQQLTAFRIVKSLTNDNSVSENGHVLVKALKNFDENFKSISFGKLNTFIRLVDFCIGYASETQSQVVWEEVCVLLRRCGAKIPPEHSRIKEYISRVICRIDLLPEKEAFTGLSEKTQEAINFAETEVMGSGIDTTELHQHVFEFKTGSKLPDEDSVKSNPQDGDLEMEFEVETDSTHQGGESMQLHSACENDPACNGKLSADYLNEDVLKSGKCTAFENTEQHNILNSNGTASKNQLHANNLDLRNGNFEDSHLNVIKTHVREMIPSTDIISDNCESGSALSEQHIEKINMISNILQTDETSEDVSSPLPLESNTQNLYVTQQGSKPLAGNFSASSKVLEIAKLVSDSDVYHPKKRSKTVPLLTPLYKPVAQYSEYESADLVDTQPEYNVDEKSAAPVLQNETYHQVRECDNIASQPVQVLVSNDENIADENPDFNENYVSPVLKNVVYHQESDCYNTGSQSISILEPINQNIEAESQNLIGVSQYDELAVPGAKVGACYLEREEPYVISASQSLEIQNDQDINAENSSVLDELAHVAKPAISENIENSVLMALKGAENETGISQSMPLVLCDQSIGDESQSLIGVSAHEYYPEKGDPHAASVPHSLSSQHDGDSNTESRISADESPHDAEPTVPAYLDNSDLVPLKDAGNKVSYPSTTPVIHFLSNNSLMNTSISLDYATDKKIASPFQTTPLEHQRNSITTSVNDLNSAMNTETIFHSGSCDPVAGSHQGYGELAIAQSTSLQVQCPQLAGLLSNKSEISIKKSEPEVVDLCLSDDDDCEIEYQLVNDVIMID